MSGKSSTAFSTAQSSEAYEANKPDRVYGSGTLGTEFFVRRTVTLDFSARAMVHAGESRGYPLPHSAEGSINKLDHEFVVSAGLHFYVLD